MKNIRYEAKYDTPQGTLSYNIVVIAQNINSGWTKAIRRAISGLPKGWVLDNVTYRAVE